MTLKGKTEVYHDMFLDIKIDDDLMTICTYKALQKAQYAYRDGGKVSLQVLTGKDSPVEYSPMPPLTHNTPFTITKYAYDLVVDGKDMGAPDYFFVRVSQITFGYVDNELMRPEQAGTYSNWYIPIESMSNSFKTPYNWLVKSFIGKDSGFKCEDQVLAQVAPAYYGAPMSECAVRINVDPRYGYRSNTKFDTKVGLSHKEFGKFITQTMPVITADVDTLDVEQNGYTEVSFSVTDRITGEPWTHPMTVFLEETGGYLPLKRIDVTDGSGAFTVGTLGLKPGNVFKVKLGARFYSGVSEVVFNVV